jgi:hypothetical protein
LICLHGGSLAEYRRFELGRAGRFAFQSELARGGHSAYRMLTMKIETSRRIALFLSIALLGAFSLSAQTLKTPAILTDSRAYQKAEENLLLYFRNVFMASQEFKDSFGDVTWEDVSEDVTSSVDIVRDRKTEANKYGNTVFVFTGFVWDDIYVQLVLNPSTGELKEITMELP